MKMKCRKSDWEKHQQAWQQERGPYWNELWEAIEKHTDRNIPEYKNWFRIIVPQGIFDTLDELTAKLEEKRKNGRQSEEKYFPPLTLFQIKEPQRFEPNYLVLLRSQNEVYDYRSNPGYFLCRLIAKKIWERGMKDDDPLNKELYWNPSCDLRADFAGYHVGSLMLLNRTAEEERHQIEFGKKSQWSPRLWEHSCYQINKNLVNRFALDLGQYQRIINCEQYNDVWDGFEKQFGKAIEQLARAFAVSGDPEAMIKGLAGTALLGKMFQK